MTTTHKRINRLGITNDDKRVLRALFSDDSDALPADRQEAVAIVRRFPSSFGEGDKRKLVDLSLLCADGSDESTDRAKQIVAKLMQPASVTDWLWEYIDSLGGGSASPPAEANIIHYWKDDGFTGSGSTLEWTDSVGSRVYKVFAFDDNSGNNLSVTQQNGIDVLDFGGAVAMKDGAGSYLVGDNLPWTRAIIYKPDGVASNQTILEGTASLANRKASLRILSTGALNGVGIYFAPTTVQSTVTAALHTDVITCDGNASSATFKSYYDGAAYDTTPTVTDAGSSLGIGDLGHRGVSAGSDNYSGLVCEIIVWDIELTEDQVSELHDYLIGRFNP